MQEGSQPSPGGDRFHGVRYITSWDADASIRNPEYPSPSGLLAKKTFREGFALLGRFGLSPEAMLYHPQIDELASLAGALPDVKIVLNHSGVPLGIGAYGGKRDEVVFRRRRSTASSIAMAYGAFGLRCTAETTLRPIQ